MPLPDRLDTQIKAFISDVDGCWTDGGMYFGADGQLMKRFDVKDGFGVGLLAARGIPVIWVTADNSAITRSRAERLQITEMRVCPDDKAEGVRAVLAEHGWTPEEVVYMGDDLNDLPVMAILPNTVCPADAVAEVIAAARWMCAKAGGHGAVREVCEAILRG
jgi:YrbI family 3-deoxy-D-manno-octulosonate 8-phosphate phosphatase